MIEKKKIEDLPLVGRNVLSLVALQPGINGIPSTADIFATEQGLGLTADGVRETGNNASVDGASINNGPWGGTVLLNGVPIVYSLGPSYAPNPALGRGLNASGGIQGARVALRVIDPNIETPKYYNWFASVQRQLRWHLVAEATYNGSAGRSLTKADGPTLEDYNRFAGDLLDGRRDRLNPAFDSIDFNRSVSRSNYNGLSLQVLRRYARGWSFQTVYNAVANALRDLS